MLAALLSLCCALPQPAAEPDRLLALIRQKMSDNLARLPDYTCRQTIERDRRSAGSKRFAFSDRLRLDVSYVGGKELFAWPGAERFEEQAIHDIIRGGAVGTGSFALHARYVFTTDSATFEYKGTAEEEGRHLARFDFRVPLAKSKYVVSSGPAADAVVGYHGSFWADAVSFELLRFEVEVEEVPKTVAVSAGGEKIQYRRTRIGASEFLLPRASDLYMTDRAGNESHNHVDFESCHQYMGESVVKFGEVDLDSAAAAPKAPKLLPSLPAGLEVEVLLDTTMDAVKSAIGDPVRATVLKAVKKENQAIVPKDAVLTGRITRMEQRPGRPGMMYLMGVQLDRIEHDKARGVFQGVLDSVAFPGNRRYVAVPAGKDDLPGEGMFVIQGGQSSEVTRLRMVWRTVDAR